MKPKKLITILSLSALVIAAAFGAVAYHSAKASALTSNQSSVIVNQPVNVDTYGKGSGGGYTNEDLAKALAITVDELTAAQKTAKESVLAQAVAKGLITQAQADKFKSNAAGFSLGHMRGLLSSADLTAAGIDYDTELAKALGITVEKLQAAYTQASVIHIDQAVADGTITQNQADLMKDQKALYADAKFQASMKSAYESAVAQAVQDGVITQAQADLILSNSNGLNYAAPHGIDNLPGLGGPRGDHGRGGNLGNDQPADSTTAPTNP
jgi:polyhydroxyalkanoate synthesis regulator phasin